MADRKFFLQLAENEGYSPVVYKDSRGFQTVGYGSRLYGADDRWLRRHGHTVSGLLSGKERLEREEARLLMVWRHRQIVSMLPAEDLELYRKLDDDVRAVLDDLFYNMGPGFLSKFPMFRKALFDYVLWGDASFLERAADELQYRDGKRPALGVSGYYRQTGQRAKRNVAILRRIAEEGADV